MKSEKKLMSIGETAKSLGVTRRMILNYEARGLLKPDAKEGDTGNRCYTPDTFTRIRSVRVFQNMGLTLDEIRGYFDGSTDLAPLVARLEALRDELNLNIEKLRERMKDDGDDAVSTVTLPRQTVYRRTQRAATLEERKTNLRDIVPAAALRYGSDTTKRMYFIEYPLDDADLVSCCMAVPEGSAGECVAELPETRALCLYHHGAYEDIPAVREKLLAYAREHGMEPAGVCRHIYLEGPPQHKDPGKFITQVALPIAEP